MIDDELLQAPQDFDFYSAVYALHNQARRAGKTNADVGEDNFPRHEAVRFSVAQQVGFAGPPITNVTKVENSNQLDMAVSFFGLTGTSGVLPLHYTETIIQRMRNKDHALRDFFDMINNRLIALYYRSWEKYRFAIGYESGGCRGEDKISQILRNIAGAEEDLDVYFSGYFRQAVRNETNLRNMLCELIDADVSIETMLGQWIKMEPDETTRLCSQHHPEGNFACLGVNSMLGDKMWDLSSNIAIRIKLNNDEDFDGLKPNSPKRQLIEKLVARYLGPSIKADIKIQANYEQIIKPRLGQPEMQLAYGAMLLYSEKAEAEHQVVFL